MVASVNNRNILNVAGQYSSDLRNHLRDGRVSVDDLEAANVIVASVANSPMRYSNQAAFLNQLIGAAALRESVQAQFYAQSSSTTARETVKDRAETARPYDYNLANRLRDGVVGYDDISMAQRVYEQALANSYNGPSSVEVQSAARLRDAVNNAAAHQTTYTTQRETERDRGVYVDRGWNNDARSWDTNRNWDSNRRWDNRQWDDRPVHTHRRHREEDTQITGEDVGVAIGTAVAAYGLIKLFERYGR